MRLMRAIPVCVLVLCHLALDVAGQRMRPLEPSPACVQRCMQNNKGCRDCVRQLAERLSTPHTMAMPFHKAHPGLPDPVIGVTHHDFLDRPPWVGGSMPAPHPRIVQVCFCVLGAQTTGKRVGLQPCNPGVHICVSEKPQREGGEQDLVGVWVVCVDCCGLLLHLNMLVLDLHHICACWCVGGVCGLLRSFIASQHARS